jgi:predicted DNA-binding protein (MmcQ/YjbR family)
MDAERARKFLLSLQHVVETMQWGDNLVFWTGDKAIGGKMFALVNLDKAPLNGKEHGVVSYAAGPERFAELVERDGLKPAPYMARIFWVAAERWSALRDREWEEEFRGAHAITLAKLPKRVREVLAMPERERAKLISARRKLLAEREAQQCKAREAKRKTEANNGKKQRQKP